MGNHFASDKTMLNGWWDFLPQHSSDRPGAPRPDEGWHEKAFLVPSVWSKSRNGWRLPGDTHFKPGLPPDESTAVEWFGDAFGYPDGWNRTRTAWLRRMFAVKPCLQADGFSSAVRQSDLWRRS